MLKLDISDLVEGVYDDFPLDNAAAPLAVLLRAARLCTHNYDVMRVYLPRTSETRKAANGGWFMHIEGDQQLTKRSVLALMSTMYPNAPVSAALIHLREKTAARNMLKVDAERLLTAITAKLSDTAKTVLLRRFAMHSAVSFDRSAVAISRLITSGVVCTSLIDHAFVGELTLRRNTPAVQVDILKTWFMRDDGVRQADVDALAADYSARFASIRNMLVTEYDIDVWKMVTPLNAGMTRTVISEITNAR